MGAHLVERDGVRGVMFCLWAPHARSVSLLADINSWDGRHHPMQLRNGGIWELFIPGMEEGSIYKYEIRSQEGHCYQKADPHGFQHEVRPPTAPWCLTSRASTGATPAGCSSETAEILWNNRFRSTRCISAADSRVIRFPWVQPDGTPRAPVQPLT